MLTKEQLQEQWRPVKGYERLYEISNLGRVRSLDKKVKCGYGAYRIMKGKILSLTLGTTGSLRCALGSEQKFKTTFIHRIVAMAFLTKTPERNYVNHKNGIKTDNRIENLEWCTKHEDCQHAQDTGLSKARYKARKLSLEQAREIVRLRKLTHKGGYGIGKILNIPKHLVDGVIYRGTYPEVQNDY
jgi:hypothetical protein